MYVPDGVLAVVAMASADVPEVPGFNETPLGVKVMVKLGSLGKLVAVRLTLPVSPMLEMVTVDPEVPPATNEAGVAA